MRGSASLKKLGWHGFIMRKPQNTYEEVGRKKLIIKNMLKTLAHCTSACFQTSK